MFKEGGGFCLLGTRLFRTTCAATWGTKTRVCALGPTWLRRCPGGQPHGLKARALFLFAHGSSVPTASEPLAPPGSTGLERPTPSPVNRPFPEVLDGPRSPQLLLQPQVGCLVSGLHHSGHGQLLLHERELPSGCPLRRAPDPAPHFPGEPAPPTLAPKGHRPLTCSLLPCSAPPRCCIGHPRPWPSGPWHVGDDDRDTPPHG